MGNAKPDKRANQRHISSYWCSPIPGGYNFATLELITLGKFEAQARKGDGDKVVEEEFDQLSFLGNNQCIPVSYPGHIDLWGEFSNVRQDGEETPKQGAN